MKDCAICGEKIDAEHEGARGEIDGVHMHTRCDRLRTRYEVEIARARELQASAEGQADRFRRQRDALLGSVISIIVLQNADDPETQRIKDLILERLKSLEKAWIHGVEGIDGKAAKEGA